MTRMTDNNDGADHLAGDDEHELHERADDDVVTLHEADLSDDDLHISCASNTPSLCTLSCSTNDAFDRTFDCKNFNLGHEALFLKQVGCATLGSVCAFLGGAVKREHG